MTYKTVYRNFFAWVILVLGVLLIFRQFSGVLFFSVDSDDVGYLRGVIERSFGNYYQLFLLAGALALLPHFAWTMRMASNEAAMPAYDQFGTWGQSLFTSLGFLGTIVGVSLAVAGLEDAVVNQSPGTLIGGLSTAFDTTFLGLTGAIQLLIFRKISSLQVGR